MKHLRRIVYKKEQNSIKYTNQVYENGKWIFFNRFMGKFGATPVIWYDNKELAEQFAPKDYKKIEIDTLWQNSQ